MPTDPKLSVGMVKWYGGLNRSTGRQNDYGFLRSLSDGTDIYVSRSDLRCDPAALQEGTLVTFETADDPRGTKAIGVQLLDQHTTRELLKVLSEAEAMLVWEVVLPRAVRRITKAEAASYLQKRLPELSTDGRSRIIRLIPREIVIEVPAVREYLEPEVLVSDWSRTLQSKGHDGDLVEEIARICAGRNDVAKAAAAGLPAKWATSQERIRKAVGRSAECHLLARLLSEDDSPKNREQLIASVKEAVKTEDLSMVWPLIPPATILQSDVWEVAPHNARLRAAATMANAPIDEQAGREALQRLSELLCNMGETERVAQIRQLRSSVKWSSVIRAFVPPADEVDEVAARQPVILQANAWEWMSWRARILSVYRAASSGRPAIGPLNVDPKSLEGAVLRIWLAGAGSQVEKHQAARGLTDALLNWTTQRAWKVADPIDLRVLIPPCSVPAAGVPYCEGKLLGRSMMFERERAYCPRTRKTCELVAYENRSGRPERTAHIRATLTLPWTRWSLMELLDRSAVTPYAEDLRRSDEFVPRLAGWLNRLHEIRARLHCRMCGELFHPSFEYSKKFTARYSLTVAGCTRGIGHDEQVYFSHCWFCQHIIDSRDNPIRVEGFYLCIHCGSGPQTSVTYSQGDLCPKCGTDNVVVAGDLCSCQKPGCHHSFRVPPQSSRTGAGRWQTYDDTSEF